MAHGLDSTTSAPPVYGSYSTDEWTLFLLETRWLEQLAYNLLVTISHAGTHPACCVLSGQHLYVILLTCLLHANLRSRMFNGKPYGNPGLCSKRLPQGSDLNYKSRGSC